MKKLIAAIFMAILFGSASFAADNDSTTKERYYEGSVSLIYSYLISPGIYTTHGVRIDNGKHFIGGSASLSAGLFDGFSANLHFTYRLFYTDKEKFDAYIGCGAGYYHDFDPYRGTAYASNHTPDVNQSLGLNLIPEIGWGIKLRNGDMIDISIICSVKFRLYDSWTDYYISKGKDATDFGLNLKPGLKIGYRF